jgi:hypothetical protein
MKLTTTETECEALFRRALAADYRLQAVDRMVRALVALAPTRRSGIPMCVGCVWDLILKPAVVPILGWERGYPPKDAKDPDPDKTTWESIDLTEWLGKIDSKPEPASATEEWPTHL